MEEIGTIWTKDDQEIVFQVGLWEGRIWGDVRVFRIKNHKPQLWGVRLNKDDVKNILEKIRNLPKTPNFTDEEILYKQKINDKYILFLRLLYNTEKEPVLDLRYYRGETGDFGIKGLEIPYKNLSEAIKYFELMLKEWETLTLNSEK